MLSNEETRDQRIVWGTTLVSGRKSVPFTKIVWVTPTAVAGVHDQLRRFVPQTTWSPEKVVCAPHASRLARGRMARRVRRFAWIAPRMAIFVLATLSARPARAQVLLADVSTVMAQQVLEAHNGERCLVRPAAEVMPAIQWDTALATVARNYAATCPIAHNVNRSSDYAALGGSGYVGENLVFATPGSSMVRMMRALAREKFDYSYERHPTGHYPVGHYSQMIWAGTTRVGCGQAMCGNAKILVCNYSPGGNIIGRFPYTPAEEEPVTTDACTVSAAPALPVMAAPGSGQR